MTIILNRREFLKAALSAAAAGIIVPAWMPPRDPYVKLHDLVTFIGDQRTAVSHAIYGSGGGHVEAVGEWDTIGYPTRLGLGHYGRPPTQVTLYDFELAEHLSYPRNIWHSEENCRRYPNVHAYFRMQRFGETSGQALRALNTVRSPSMEHWYIT